MMTRKKNPQKIVPYNGFTENLEYDNIVEYDYDRQSHCEEAGCDTICRCTTIEDLKITKININNFVQYIAKKMKLVKSTPKHLILTYCIDRLLHIYQVYQPDCWEVRRGFGYYGEEVKGTYLNENKAQELRYIFAELVKAQNPIEFVLNQEYGYLLKEVENQRWTIRFVPLKNIHIKQEDHMRKIHRGKEEELYQNYSLPIGVCIKTDTKGHYRLIDGYHRYHSADSNNKKKVDIIINR